MSKEIMPVITTYQTKNKLNNTFSQSPEMALVHVVTQETADGMQAQRDADYIILQKTVREIFQKIEDKSHPQATNMLGISLSREDWQALKSEIPGGREMKTGTDSL
jgi:hypothetical protein